MASTAVSNLSGLINLSNSNVLNAEGRPSLSGLFSSDCSSVVRSDADEQLLVNVQFSTQVKIKAISITAPAGEERPTIVKLFINQRNMDFDNTDIPATQVLKLTENSVKADTMIPLNFVKFQRVASIAVFIEDNDGGEQTSLNSLRFYGEPVASMDMKDWKPIKG